jgi:VCBS repeat protein
MSSSVVVFLGNGDGTFRPPVAYKTGHSPLNVSVLDLNGDRHLDLLVVNGERDDISVFFGKGDGTFTQGVSFGANAGPIATVTQDFDGDGKTDIAVANNLSSDLSVLLGKGDGTFWQPPRSYRTGAAPFVVTAVSFAPQDPRPGLVTANNLANTISIFLAKDPRSNLVPRN